MADQIQSDRGGKTVTLEQWERENGYNRKTRLYRKAESPPRAVPRNYEED